MRHHLAQPLSIAAAIITLGAASSSHAVMYKWIEDNGKVTYSNTPPADVSKVRNFIAIEDVGDIPPSAKAEAGAAAAKPSTDVAPASASAPSRAGDRTATIESSPPRPPATVTTEPPRREGETPRTVTAPRPASRGLVTEAVQDPCLRSADPRCYERNKDKYHPYLGYAPSARAATPTAAVGASSSAAAGGAVGAYVKTTPVITPVGGATPKIKAAATQAPEPKRSSSPPAPR